MTSTFFRVFRLAFKTLILHKLRTGLAMLGILIGVTAVIWLVAMGEGVSYQAQKQIEDLGARNIIVRSVKPPQESSTARGGLFVEYGLLRDDYDRIVETIPTISRAVPMREISQEVRYSDRVADIRMIGCTPDYFEVNHLHMYRGRFLSDRDNARKDNVCVIADGAATVLFPYEDPIGKAVMVGRQFYVVIGQTAERTPSASVGGSLEGRNYNLDIYIPIKTLRARIGDMVFTSRSGSREGEIVQLNQITVMVDEIEHVEDTADIIHTSLERFHPTADYSITVPKELLKQAATLRMMFNVLLILIAGISLVVGGIGIMNIMLATVTERTREIGVRRALGAKQRDIVRQFLAEAIVLTGIGGVMGVFCGFLCHPVILGLQTAIERFRPDIWSSLPPTIQQLQPIIALWSIFAAFGISVLVGISFGLYPACRAALMDPIEALRHE